MKERKFNNESEIKRYNGPIIYITKYEDVDVEKLLDIIVRHIESYVRQERVMPDKLILSKNNFDRIMNHNKTLIARENDKYYTFGVEVEIQVKKEDKRIFNRKFNRRRHYEK